MPTPVYTNKDLKKPLYRDSKTKVYTNKDLPQEDDFIPDDFKPDEKDDFVPDEIGDVGPPMQGDNYKGPDTWKEGFLQSLGSGEAGNAGLQGLKGYAKGAILDIPQSIEGMVKTVYDAATEGGHPTVNLIKKIPSGIASVAKGIKHAYDYGGSEPEQFGEIMGQLTGQPIVTEGMIKASPSVIRGAGAVTEGAGRTLQNYPLTDFVPGSRFVIPPAIRRLDRNVLSGAVGKGVEKVGQKMRGFDKRPLQGEVVSEDLPTIKEGEIIQPTRKELPPSKVSYYGTEGANPPGKIRTINNKVVGPVASPLEEGQIIHPDVETSYRRPLVEGEELPKPTKPKVRLNPDGTYTDLNTGEVYDSKGKPMAESMPESEIANPKEPILPKNRTIENAPPNQRAKIMRGVHDAVDVLFEDPNSREIFGAGQSLNMSKSSSMRSNILQRFGDASKRIAEQYKLTPEQARGAIIQYNKHIRELSKAQPKYGDGLNFKATSFDDFLQNIWDGSKH